MAAKSKLANTHDGVYQRLMLSAHCQHEVTVILCDIDLRSLLPDLNIKVENANRPFDADEQIKSASIDLRIDRVFWEPAQRRYRDIDLTGNRLDPEAIKKDFRRRSFRHGEKIRVRPGEMLLGRTYEQFTMPNGHAGKIEGRSSLARLGLSVHCTGDFINPGWEGHMPVQLVNHGRATVVIAPYISLCQLVVIRTTGLSQRPYGDKALDSKYTADEGGPSRYWEDIRLKKLQAAIGRVNLPAQMTKSLRGLLSAVDADTIDRFEAFLGKLPASRVTNARDVAEEFARQERMWGIWDLCWRGVMKASPGILVGTAASALSNGFVPLWLAGATAAGCAAGLYAWALAATPVKRLSQAEVDDYFENNE